MKKLIALIASSLVLFAAGALAPADGIAGKGGGIIESGCAATLGIESASACGNGDTIPLVWSYVDGPSQLCAYQGWTRGVLRTVYLWSNAAYPCPGYTNPW